MQRRTLIKAGLAGTALLAVAGGALVLLDPGRRQGRLTSGGRALFAAVARTVVGPLLPSDPGELRHALDEHLARMESTITAMPPAVRSEVDEMVALLVNGAGRLALTGQRSAWAEADVPEVSATLQGLRFSSLALRQQVYHALRDLTNAAYFADPAACRGIGYPGPLPL
jgi:hypothetical protein